MSTVPISRYVSTGPLLVVAVTVAFAIGPIADVAARGHRDVRVRAKAHFDRGEAAFARGEYREALLEYDAAYRLTPLAGLLFNIAQCHRNLGSDERAIYTYRLYLAKAPRAGNRDAVLSLIAELEAKVAAQRRTAASSGAGDGGPAVVVEGETTGTGAQPSNGHGTADTDTQAFNVTANATATPIKRDETRPWYKRWWVWTAVGAAVIGGAVGIYLGTQSSGGSGWTNDTNFPDPPLFNPN